MVQVAQKKVSVCFVCLGNICRSPTAEGVFTKLVDAAGLSAHLVIDSAGTAAYHAGERADVRSRATARARGYNLSSIARQFVQEDFGRFDYVLAMDAENMANLGKLSLGEADRKKLYLLRDFDLTAKKGLGVPDPYYGSGDGFEEVLMQCERACNGFIEHLRDHELNLSS